MVIKELGLVFTELGRPFVLRSELLQFQGVHNFLSFYQWNPAAHTTHKAFADLHNTIKQKISERGKTIIMVYNTGYSN